MTTFDKAMRALFVALALAVLVMLIVVLSAL